MHYENELNALIGKTRGKYEEVMAYASSGVYLYGAGFIGRWAVDYLECSGVPVLGFVDSDQAKWGKVLENKRIFSPNDKCIRDAKVVLITSRHAVRSVEKFLETFAAVVMSIDAFIVHRASREFFESVSYLFQHDERSLRTFYAVIAAMVVGNTQPLELYADNRPFFSRFGFFNRNQEIFVDAGAYVGDSLERFVWSVNGVFRQIHAFEPGLTQFKALKNRVRRLRQEWALSADSIFLVNKGLSDENRVVTIGGDKNLTQMAVLGANSLSDLISGSRIETVSLDTYFKDNMYTFLKVDVEGSESALLRGASNSIFLYRPRIALSVYHYPTDILELPLLLHQLNKDYLFYLGHHSSQLMETIVYARDKNE